MIKKHQTLSKHATYHPSDLPKATPILLMKTIETETIESNCQNFCEFY